MKMSAVGLGKSKLLFCYLDILYKGSAEINQHAALAVYLLVLFLGFKRLNFYKPKRREKLFFSPTHEM